MKKLSAFFYRISTGWVVLAGLVVFLVFSSLTLPVESKRMDAYSQGLGSPDTSLFYSGKLLYHMAEIYGEAGRDAFLKARWGFDLAFPLIYGFFLVTSISYLFKRYTMGNRKFYWLNLIPLLGLILDLAENTATSVVMANYPIENRWAELLAPVFTPIKWLFVSISMIILAIGLLLRLISAIKIIGGKPH